MDSSAKPSGKTTIAPEVLVSIAQLSTLGVEGVSHLTPGRVEVNKLFKRGVHEGVDITVEENVIYIDLYVVLKRDVKVLEVSHQIQKQVARSISEMVGLEIGRINVHVEDINFQDE